MRWGRDWDVNPPLPIGRANDSVPSERPSDYRRKSDADNDITAAVIKKRAHLPVSSDDQLHSFIQQTLRDSSSAPGKGNREESEWGASGQVTHGHVNV